MFGNLTDFNTIFNCHNLLLQINYRIIGKPLSIMYNN